MFIHRKFLRTRRNKLLCVSVILVVFAMCVWRIHYVATLATPVSREPALEHFRRNRNISYYMNNIHLLAEPSSTPCDSLYAVPLLVLVASAPSRYEHRDAIRATWAPHFPTYFLLGLNTQDADVANVYLEAKQYDDLIVYDFQEHYQNLTLKTALMLRWTLGHCASVGFLLKSDDDVLVSPWMMANVLKDNTNAKLIGYKHRDVRPCRSEYSKWYLPRWLFQQDAVPEYLLGAAYLIHGKYIDKMLYAAAEVPLINLEDIYFSYLVARRQLGLELTHDARLSPYTHWFPLPCAYWRFAISHGLSPRDISILWSGLLTIATDYSNNVHVCTFHNVLGRFVDFFNKQ